MLPIDLMSQEQQQHDYSTVRLWHSHYSESRLFCRNFSNQVIQSRLGKDQSTRTVFGPSLFAREERIGQDNDVYGRHSEVWEAMVRLAGRDPSFAKYISDEGLNPQDPVSDDIRKRDECLRKVKPIVLLREAYFKGAEREHRSRKSTILYAGEETIYAMSEGNPRLLAGLINQLLDAMVTRSRPGFVGSGEPRMPREVQSKVLRGASSRMRSFIRAYPTQTGGRRKLHLAHLTEKLGDFLFNQLVGREFPGDPMGSFVVDTIEPSLQEEVGRSLLIGAFVSSAKPRLTCLPQSWVPDSANSYARAGIPPPVEKLSRGEASTALRIAQGLSPQMEMYAAKREV